MGMLNRIGRLMHLVKDEAPASLDLSTTTNQPSELTTPRTPRRSADWVTVNLTADFASVKEAAVAEIPTQTKVAEEVPGLVLTMFQPLLDTASTSVRLALDGLKSKATALQAKAGEISDTFNQEIAVARAQFEDVAKPHIVTVQSARTDRANRIARLNAEKRDLPQQIADYEYALTGDRRIRVDRIDKTKFNAVAALITMVIGGMDLLLASVVFIIAQDDTTAYVIGAAYALALGFAMHQRASFGAQIQGHKEAAENNPNWLASNPKESGKLMPLAESVSAGHSRWTKILVGLGISMAVIRILVAALTAHWDQFVMSFIITIVAFGVALIGSEFLMKFAAKYGKHHDTVADLKDRLESGIDVELSVVENLSISDPAELAAAKVKYTEAVANAVRTAKASIDVSELVDNASAVLKSEADFHARASRQFLLTCLAVLEVVIVPEVDGQEVEVDEDDLRSHFTPSATPNPLTGLSLSSTLPSLTSTPTADQLDSELVRKQPVPVVKPAPQDPPPPPSRVKLILRKRNRDA